MFFVFIRTTKRLENAGRPEARNIARVLREVETHSDMALSAEFESK